MTTKKRIAEKTIRDTRRATRRHYSVEERFVLHWKVFGVKTVLLNVPSHCGNNKFRMLIVSRQPAPKICQF